MREDGDAPVMCRSLGVAAPFELAFFELAEPPLVDGAVRVETLFSGLSAGTELTFVKGTNPYLGSRWDADLGLFQPGPGSSSYPVRAMGYMEVGRVTASRSPHLAQGQVVAAAYGHRSSHVLAAEGCVPLPDTMDPVLGVYLAQMGPICANGLLHASALLSPGRPQALGEGVRGRRVLVTGAGVVGLLSALFARHHGAAQVAVADPDPARLAAARGLGLGTVDERDQPAWQWCKDTWRHGPRDVGADLVLQCRGRAAALHGALRALRPQGVVVDLAFYQGGADDLRLGEEFHHNGLTVQCAQINRVPRGLAGAWDRRRLAEETVDLLSVHGTAVREHVVSDVVPIEDAPRLVDDLAHRRRSVLQAVFRYP